VDHEIAVGPTFNNAQNWEDTPANQSVTDRLFTAAGASTTSPVLFLGLTANVIPGGTLDNPTRQPGPKPGQVVMKPNQQFIDQQVNKGTSFTWTRKFENIGEQDSVIKFSNMFTAYQGNYRFETGNPAGQPPTIDRWLGDKLIDWSYTILGNYRPGPNGFANTVSLSAGESVDVEYSVNATTDNLRGYEVGLSHTIENTGKVPETSTVRFDIDV